MSIDQLKRDFHSVGIMGILVDLFIRLANSVTFFKVLHCLAIEETTLHHEIKELHPKYTERFLTQEEVENFLQVEATRMPEYVVELGLDKQDECLGLLDNERLINYCWYSDLPTRLNKNLEVHFNPQYKYAYRSYTIIPFRGQRLQGLNLYHALQIYRKQGYRGIVAYVDSNNFNSRRSLDHLGFQLFERIFILKLFDTYLIYKTSDSMPFQFSIQLTDLARKKYKIRTFTK
ncbi:MAG: hypothetical protein H6696_01235 [Deferribacteres bacterium]|nr:hypothetical protein [candidate division KSB1 bacterium]MCB9500532.1 hypothetical protein [Deferribacteres bacterium]